MLYSRLPFFTSRATNHVPIWLYSKIVGVTSFITSNTSKLSGDGESVPVLPSLTRHINEGLMRIKHYGFLLKRYRNKKLAKIRRYIAQSNETALNPRTEQKMAKPITILHCPCPKYKAGILQAIAEILAIKPQSSERRQYVS